MGIPTAKVLHLTSSRGFYGAERAILNLIRSAGGQGCDISLADFYDERYPNDDLMRKARQSGIRTFALPCSRRLDRRAYGRLTEILDAQRFELLHCHELKSRFYGLLAARNRQLPVVTTHHNWIGGHWFTRALEALDGLLLRYFDSIVAVSHSVGRRVGRFWIPADRIIVIANGVDLEAFKGASAVDRSSREALGIEPTAKVIGAVGRLEPGKGFQQLIRAAPDVLAEFPSTCFLIVGEGPLRDSLSHQASLLGLDGQLIFTGYRSDMPALFALMDLYVLPSRNEGMPMTLLEAMASGVPAIASGVGGITEVIAHGTSGILLPEPDPHLLANEIIHLLRHPLLAARLAENGRLEVIRQYSMSRVADQYRRLYQKILTGSIPDHRGSVAA